MKKLIFIFVIIFSLVCSTKSFAQTDYQKKLLKEFFWGRGKTVIANWAHPVLSIYGSKTSVYVSDNYTYITIYYEGIFVDFSCTYKIYINSRGVFSDLEVSTEGCINPCFETCNNVQASIIEAYETDYATKKRVETQLGKSINNFTCKDYCLLGLSYYWGYDGYYSKY